jgi:hypothetical protein
MIINTPNKEEVNYYLKKWKTLDRYVLQESSLDKLFLKTYTKNTKMDNVLIKVCSLNDFYSTNIFSPFSVAKHIVRLNIDKYLDKDNLDIVNKISKVRMNGGNIKHFYSFATKYCSHHKSEVYPIYDYYVEKMLMYFKKIEKFDSFKKEDLKKYERFLEIIYKFKQYYNLGNFSLRQIDIYLWLAGKEYFPNKY